MGFIQKLKDAKKSYDKFQNKRRISKIKSYKQKAQVERAKSDYEDIKYRREEKKLKLQEKRASVALKREKVAKSRAQSFNFGGSGTNNAAMNLSNNLLGSTSFKKRKGKNPLDQLL